MPKLLDVLSQLRSLITAISEEKLDILFTIRSAVEGGNAELSLVSEERLEIYRAVCESRLADFVDFELSKPVEEIRKVREWSTNADVKLILSYHNFAETPDETFIVNKFREAEHYDGDVAKVAVMPNTIQDVFHFMNAVEHFRKQSDTPIIAISMGRLGLITRLCGWLVGSQLTFAVGDQESAPGQMPIEDVRKVIEIMKKADSGAS